MGRHRRRGPADTSDTGAIPVVPGGNGSGRRRRGTPADGTPADGTPAQGTPRPRLDGNPPRPARRDSAPPPNSPRYDGTPAQGIPRPQFDGTPAHGFPRHDGTPAHGMPQAAPGAPRARGGHPQQREPGGGWGAGAAGAPGGPAAPGGPRQAARPGRQGGAPGGPGATVSGPGVISAARAGGPRKEYLDAFDGLSDPNGRTGDPGSPGSADRAEEEPSVFAPRKGAPRPMRTAAASSTAPSTPADRPEDEDVALDTEAKPTTADAPPPEEPRRSHRVKPGKGRALTGIVAAAVATVLAVVVTGQLTGGKKDDSAQGAAGSESDGRRQADPASRSDHRPTPADSKPEAPAKQTYEQKMATVLPLEADLDLSGEFEAVPGFVAAPGKGQVIRYRVDVEKDLGLDGKLFAEAVQKTLNDRRSWAHNGERSFERVSSGQPDFVITLASPGTTNDWCAKSGLDTSVDIVSCDSAATERVMVNGYRWAQGAETFGDSKIWSYRQMLINHEVGHRLGFNHVNCTRDGALAPVMQQQTKFLTSDGVTCKPNAWVYPHS